MLLAAKYPSTCPACSRPIRVGAQIEWTKGSQARHVSCASVATSPAPTKRTRASAPRVARLPSLVGESSEIACSFAGSRSERAPAKSIGDAAWVRIDGERTPCVVVGYAPARWTSGEVLEDMGHYTASGHGQWLGTVYYRRATDAEAAPLRAESDHKAAVEAARAEGAARGAAFRAAELDALEVEAMGELADESGRPVVAPSYEAPEAGMTWETVTHRPDAHGAQWGWGVTVSVATTSDGRRCVRRTSVQADSVRTSYYVATAMAVAS